MHTLTAELVKEALDATGRVLSAEGFDPRVTVIICGSIAGLLGGHFDEDRRTLDCDVISGQPEERLGAIWDAATSVAKQFDLKPNWLNNDSKMFAHLLPLGWRERMQEIGAFGPLDVYIIGRLDLIALKLVGAVKRSVDMEDLGRFTVSAQDRVFLGEHLDRLESEDLDRDTRDAERELLERL